MKSALPGLFLLTLALVSPAARAAGTSGGRKPPAVAPAPSPSWKGSLDLSASANRGNSDTSLLAVRLGVEGKGAAWRMVLSGAYDYGEDSGVNNLRKGSLRDRLEWPGRRPFPWLEAAAEHDLFGGVDLRLTFSAGVGAELKREKSSLALRLGAGYMSENAVSASDDKESAVLTAGLDWEVKTGTAAVVSVKLRWTHELGPWRLVSELTLRFGLSERLSFRFGFEHGYDSRPPSGKSPNEFSILAGLGYVF